MKITSIELDNIKSYRRQTISFTDGVNAISGHNGSGKTTILEAIGFALFDYLPYPQSAFVREGERSGTVRVRLQLDDGREYEVVRRVGSGAMYHVTDVESGVRLADQNKGVQEWLQKTAFDLEGDADLEALFKNAVGVPQGLMTSDFIGTSKTRKAIFDPLLQVEEYEKAWSELLQTVNNIRDRIGAVNAEIAYLEADVEKIPDLVEQQEELAAQVEHAAQVISTVEAELADVEARKASLDELQRAVTALEGQLRERQGQVKHQDDTVQRERAAVGMAEEALDTVRRTEPAYRRVEEARRRLLELEKDRSERDRLKEQANSATSHMTEIEQAITGRDLERTAAIADGKAAAELQPEVGRQVELERDLHEAQLHAQEARRIEADLLRCDRDIAGLTRAMETRETQIAGARAAAAEAARMHDVMARQRDVLAQMALLQPTQDQMKILEADGKRLRAQFDDLTADVERLSALRQERVRIEPAAAGRKELEAREREVREERIRIKATLDYQEVARIDLQRASCPLLELQCPVVQADVAVLDRFHRRVADLSSRIGVLEDEMAALTPMVQEAVAASERVHVISVDIAKLESSERTLPEITSALDVCRKDYARLSQTVADGARLRSEGDQLQREIARLQAAAGEAARLGLLEEQQERDRDGLAARTADRDRSAQDLKDRAAADAEVARITSEIQTLRDPRGRQQNLQASANRLSEIEKILRDNQSRLQEQGDRLRVAVAGLQRYEGLDERIAEQRAIEEAHVDGHRLYLQHVEEALQLDARRAALRAAEEALSAAVAAEASTTAELNDVRSRYDAEEHQRMTALHTETVQLLGTARADLEHCEKDLKAVDRELARVRRQEEKLGRKLEERTELEAAGTAVRFIRDTIRAAGPAVTETVLQNISTVANDIYAEIMDNYAVELRWDRDYDVVVQRGPDDRKFAQLSGGEQMSAALAVRLALLKEISSVDMAFFDEPTQNMDNERRVNLATQIRDIRGFNQLIVISHDDTFEHHTDNLVRLRKQEDETVVET